MPNKPKTRTTATATTKCRLSAKGEWQQKQCKRNGNVDDDDVASVTNRYRWCVGPGRQKGGCGGWLQMGTWQTNSKLLSAYFIVYAYALPTVFFSLFISVFPIDFQLVSLYFFSPLVLATLGFRWAGVGSDSLPGLLPATTTNRICVSNWQDKHFIGSTAGRKNKCPTGCGYLLLLVLLLLLLAVWNLSSVGKGESAKKETRKKKKQDEATEKQ